MTDQSAVHYGPKDEFYYKEGDQWFQKSKFFETFLKKSADQVPKEYVEAEAKREKRQNVSINPSTSKPSRLISIVSKEDSAIHKRYLKEDEKLAGKYNKLQARMEAQKEIMNSHEEDVVKPERVKTAAKNSSKARLAIFDERSKNRGRYFAETIKKSTECENSAETKNLLRSNNVNRVVRGKVAYCTTAHKGLKFNENDFFHIEDLMDFSASKNVTVINSYRFLTVNSSRGAYFDINGCRYCAEHKTLASHTHQIQCPHAECTCVKCYALDLIKPDA